MKTIIHVNQHAVKANGKNGTNNPVLTIKPISLISMPMRWRLKAPLRWSIHQINL